MAGRPAPLPAAPLPRRTLPLGSNPCPRSTAGGEAGLGKGVLVQEYRKGEQGGIVRQRRRAEEEERIDLQMSIAGTSVYSPKPPRVSDVHSGPTRPSTNLARLVPREKAEGNPPASAPRSEGGFCGVAGVHVSRRAPEGPKKGAGGGRLCSFPRNGITVRIMIKKSG